MSNLKTAVLYSGGARTFKETFENQYFQLLRKLPNPEFFISVSDDAQADDMLRLRERFHEDRIHFEKVKQPQVPEPPVDPFWLPSYRPSAPPQGILRQLWHLARVWTFFNETNGGQEFTLYVRLRPDLAFHRFDVPTDGISEPMSYKLAITPWWARWGGINDRVAFLGVGAAEAYFNTFNQRTALMRAGCPLHPETIINANLLAQGCTVRHTLATEFTSVRLDGKHVGPSITPVDMTEYARNKA